MGILQEAAILAGDLVTQPLRARVVALLTGRQVHIEKVVEEGTLLSDGSISSWPPHLADYIDHKAKNGSGYVQSTGQAVKDVSWKLEIENEVKS